MSTPGHKNFKKLTVHMLKQALPNDDNFRFRCTGCGNCCKGPGEVYFTKENINNIYKYYQLETQVKQDELYQKIVQYERNGYLVHSAGAACYFLDANNRCKIYKVRPMQCSSFPFWPSTFESKADLEFTANDCPGTMGYPAKTDKYTLLQTVRRTNKTAKTFVAGQNEPDPDFMI